MLIAVKTNNISKQIHIYYVERQGNRLLTLSNGLAFELVPTVDEQILQIDMVLNEL